MSSAYKPYVGDVGTVIRFDMQEAVAGATNLKLRIEKPRGEVVVRVAVFDTDPNKIKYTTVAGDFDEAGEFKFNPYFEKSGWKGHGDTVTQRVYALGE